MFHAPPSLIFEWEETTGEQSGIEGEQRLLSCYSPILMSPWPITQLQSFFTENKFFKNAIIIVIFCLIVIIIIVVIIIIIITVIIVLIVRMIVVIIISIITDVIFIIIIIIIIVIISDVIVIVSIITSIIVNIIIIIILIIIVVIIIVIIIITMIITRATSVSRLRVASSHHGASSGCPACQRSLFLYLSRNEIKATSLNYQG